MTSTTNHKVGIFYATISFAAWGILPIYWKVLKHVSPFEILAHRVLWSFLFVIGIIAVNKNFQKLFTVIKDHYKMRYIFLCAVLISINWGLYIWAVNTDQIIESSMGYYINPLVSVLLGIIFLRERLTLWQIASLCLALMGVLIMTLEYGKVPWIALALAFSFGLYGLFKKIAALDSLSGLALETLLIVPFALIFIIGRELSGVGALRHADILTFCMLIFAGVVTAMPLLWFAKATLLIPLTTIGFLQYLSPSISLILAVFVYHEHFTVIHFLSFSFIWGALALYSLSGVKIKKSLPCND